MQRGEMCLFCEKIAKHRTKYPVCSRCWANPSRRSFLRASELAMTIVELLAAAPELAAEIEAITQAFSDALAAAVGKQRIEAAYV